MISNKSIDVYWVTKEIWLIEQLLTGQFPHAYINTDAKSAKQKTHFLVDD